jgi:glycosyltransferase A (GT-A) superfamily protein (DUF2064 family)
VVAAGGSGAARRPRVVMMAGNPETSRRRHAKLGPLFDDASRVGFIEALLARRALAWARVVAGDGAVVESATDLAAAVAPEGPTLVVWPELPVWLPETAAAALDDLSSGCSVSIGPVFDGALYLLALAEPIPELLALAERPWHGVQALARVFGVVEQRQLEVGLLRAERGLRGPGDVHALRADPLTDAELQDLLG